MKYGSIIILILFCQFGFAQDEEPSAWSVNGYVKHLHTILKIDGINTYLTDNLLHNRLKIRYEPNQHWQAAFDVRTRMFYGDLIKLNPTYANQIEQANNAFFDLSFHLIDKPAWLLNSTVDRAYIRYSKKDWEITAGRQRINWGISTVWNPNDVFNAFSFTDFDYEERPASDAIRVKYYLGFASSIELAANLSESWNDRVMAGLLKWNIAGYDYQLLMGYVNQEWTLGGGWAGNIKNAGFKGEWSYFNAFKEGSKNSFALTTGIDYSFTSGIYVSTGYLYNSNGQTQGSLGDLFSFQLSAKNLYPFRHAIFASGAYPITPLFSSSLAIIYSPSSSQPLFLNPGLTYSIAQSWDLDLIGQMAFNKSPDRYRSPLKAAFLRIKVSF